VSSVCHVKICGVTRVEDALACVEAGASSVGLNFVQSSPRRIDIGRARQIVDALGGRVLTVAVVADMPEHELRSLLADTGVRCVQFHGSEPPALVTPFLPHAYKAVRIGAPADVERARAYPGGYLLVDAKVDGALGGTGHVFDWSLVTTLAQERKLTLAGGLTPKNVQEAVRRVRPFCVDTASGVESSPGIKDHNLIRAFVTAARTA
jgi:phosphoribosylanthranilate isomerase